MNVFDPTTIAESVIALLRQDGVSTNVFQNRPASLVKDLTDFAVVKVSGSIRDRYCFGECFLSVSLFAKDVANMKNAKKLSVMQGKVLSAVPRYVDGLFIWGTPTIVGDADDGNGYHARIIQYRITIKATQ